MTAPSGATVPVVPAGTVKPNTRTVSYRGIAYVIDVAACQVAIRTRHAQCVGKDPISTVAEAAGVQPDTVRRFLVGHATSGRVAVRIAIELGRPYDDIEPPHDASGARPPRVRPPDDSDGSAAGRVPDDAR